MTVQTLTIGKHRFVLLRERDFLKLRQRGEGSEIRPAVARDAMKELRHYRRTGKARNWTKVKADLGL